MGDERRGAFKGQTGSTRLLSTEELFEGFNEIYESADSDADASSSAVSEPAQAAGDGSSGRQSHLEITESSDAFNVRAELRSFDVPESGAVPKDLSQIPPMSLPKRARKRANSVLRAIDLLADADRENITATLRGGMLEVKLRKSRMESLGAAHSPLRASGAASDPRSA